jgi:hypothetical protein
LVNEAIKNMTQEQRTVMRSLWPKNDFSIHARSPDIHAQDFPALDRHHIQIEPALFDLLTELSTMRRLSSKGSFGQQP